MIPRTAEDLLINYLKTDKVIIVYGARQTGKSTLIENVFKSKKTKWINGDVLEDHSFLNNISNSSFRGYMKEFDYLVIDEAQRIQNIGLKLKFLYDKYKSDFQVIASGSSSFDLANKINEPLTGRKREIQIFPVSIGEYSKYLIKPLGKENLDKRLVLGNYPEVITSEGDEIDILNDLSNSNLYKDIFQEGLLKKSLHLEKLVKYLAYEIGNQISYSKLSSFLNIDPKTVERYIMLLEQAFIIFRLPVYSTNQKYEIKHSNKFFFYDNGIRNGIINDFRDLDKREDKGKLFENFCIVEFIKKEGSVNPFFFWRNKYGDEIDLIKKNGHSIEAYEMKYKNQNNYSFPNMFIQRYLPVEKEIIDIENIEGTILG